MRRLFFAALAAIAWILPAQAQDHFFPTPGNASVTGTVIMCWDGAHAVPATPNGTCPGSSGGGGGGAATIANGADVAEGSTTDVPCTLPSSATACTIEALSKAIANAVSAATPAGTAIIGKVGIDQTTPGTTNGVQVNSSALPTGASTSALQTTGNTALTTINTTLGTPMQATGGSVSVSGALPAGTNLVGKVGIDQTTPGTTNGVQVNAALPAGTNTIGNVGQVSQYPSGATALTASATGTTAATTATLAGTSGKTTYICWYSIRANATANTNVTNTITGVITGTLSSILWVPANTAGLGVDEMIFSPCVPASATNTGVAVVSGAPGTGGLVSVKAGGYQL